MLVPILVLMLEWRQATQYEENRELILWLVCYFGTMIIFTFLRLTRVPVL